MKKYRIVSYIGTAGLTYYGIQKKFLLNGWLFVEKGFRNEGEAEGYLKDCIIKKQQYGIKVHKEFDVENQPQQQ
ncbi:MAG: hypothetical protein R3213_10315 [Flavobacteriaceae bacterium]|nr:hypothetical protein [Flavobacteriaceae bacterium]